MGTSVRCLVKTSRVLVLGSSNKTSLSFSMNSSGLSVVEGIVEILKRWNVEVQQIDVDLKSPLRKARGMMVLQGS